MRRPRPVHPRSAQLATGNERGLRARAIVRTIRQIELGLNADFDALGGALASSRPRALALARRFFGRVLDCGLGGFASVRAAAIFAERQPRLGIVVRRGRPWRVRYCSRRRETSRRHSGSESSSSDRFA